MAPQSIIRGIWLCTVENRSPFSKIRYSVFSGRFIGERMKPLLLLCLLLMTIFVLACNISTLAAAPAPAAASTSVAANASPISWPAIPASTLGPTSVPATASPTSSPEAPTPTLDLAAMAAATTSAEINSGPCSPTPALEMAAATASPTSPPGLGIGSSKISPTDDMKLLYVPAGCSDAIALNKASNYFCFFGIAYLIHTHIILERSSTLNI